MPELLTIQRLKTLTGKGYQTIKPRLSAVKPKIVGKGKTGIQYDSIEALEAIYATPAGNETTQLTRARAELAVSQKAKIDLEIAAREGDLVDRSEMQKQAHEIASMARKRFEVLPSKLAAQLTDISQPAVIQGILLDEIKEILNELAAACERI